MIGPSPYFTLWQVATKWAEELNKPVMDVVQILKVDSAYKYPYPQPCPEPALKIRLVDFIGVTGNVDEYTISKATKHVLKDNAPSLEELKPGETRFRSAYWTPENVAALTFLNSADCPPEPTEEIKNHLSRFGILRDDFRKWFLGKGEPLPKFWFPENGEERNQKDEKLSGNRNDVNYEELAAFVAKRRAVGKQDKEIAAEIDQTFPFRLSNKSLGRLFNDPQNNISDDSLEQKGKRLRGKKT